MEEVLQKLFDAVLEGDFGGVKSNLQAALDARRQRIIVSHSVLRRVSRGC